MMDLNKISIPMDLGEIKPSLALDEGILIFWAIFSTVMLLLMLIR